MVYKSVYTEVDVDLEDFTDEELIEELKERNVNPTADVSLQSLYDLWVYGSRDKFEDEFRTYCRGHLGKSF
jgi:hypothetical protein